HTSSLPITISRATALKKPVWSASADSAGKPHPRCEASCKNFWRSPRQDSFILKTSSAGLSRTPSAPIQPTNAPGAIWNDLKRHYPPVGRDPGSGSDNLSHHCVRPDEKKSGRISPRIQLGSWHQSNQLICRSHDLPLSDSRRPTSSR